MGTNSAQERQRAVRLIWNAPISFTNLRFTCRSETDTGDWTVSLAVNNACDKNPPIINGASAPLLLMLRSRQDTPVAIVCKAGEHVPTLPPLI